MSPAAGRPDGREPEVRVDRLALRVTGLDAGAARALARLVAEGLASRLPAVPGGDLRRVRLQVTADAAGPGGPELLARLIAGDLGRILMQGQDPGYPGEEAAR